MSDQLKKFVTEHRMEFDSNDPPKDLWEKIDAEMSKKNTAGSKNMLLSKLTYFGFGLSVLALTVYLEKNSKINSSTAISGPVVSNSVSVKPVEDKLEENQNKFFVATPIEVSEKTQREELVQENKITPDTIAISSTQSEEGETMEEMTDEQIQDAEEEAEIEANETAKKDQASLVKNKKMGVYIPEAPEKMNTYSGTLYDGSLICSVIRAYRFPGKVENKRFKNMKGNGNMGTGATLKTVSCSNLQRRTNMNAVWLKGVSSKKLKLSLKKGFKNVVLINRNGEQITPIAISHYFKGLMVITYVGKNLDLVFKDKVELLLFFKKVEVGDRIMIDGKVQILVKEPPLR